VEVPDGAWRRPMTMGKRYAARERQPAALDGESGTGRACPGSLRAGRE
jgi:hypothetical protein